MTGVADPVVDTSSTTEVARDVLVIPNRGVELVPNIGVIAGTEAVLVVDTGMGLANAAKVLDLARDFADGKRLYLTTTHFHPEHAMGSAAFAGEATYLVNRTQADDLATKSDGYLAMFRGLSPQVAEQLKDVVTPAPDFVYEHAHALDLGGRVVHLRATGRGHTIGDQVIHVPDVDTLFTGDLVETGQFAIFPWFPPHDTDVSGLGWISVLDHLIAQHPTVVVPGHGDVGGADLLNEVGAYLRLLRDETWNRRDSDMPEADVIAEVSEVMVEVHPEWRGREWIATGVGCLCSEHARDTDSTRLLS